MTENEEKKGWGLSVRQEAISPRMTDYPRNSQHHDPYYVAVIVVVVTVMVKRHDGASLL